MNDLYEWIPTIHNLCGGQGCRECVDGEQMVRVNVEEYVA